MVDKKKERTSRKKPSKDDLIDEVVERVEELVNDELGDSTSFEEYEKAVLRITNEIARRRLQRKLQGIADGFAHELRIEHNNDWHGWRETTTYDFRKHLPGTVRYHSLVGSLEIHRFTYRECHRNGATYVPLELEAGLMERMTPGLAKAVALGASQMPTREFEKVLLASQRCPPSCATLDHMLATSERTPSHRTRRSSRGFGPTKRAGSRDRDRPRSRSHVRAHAQGSTATRPLDFVQRHSPESTATGWRESSTASNGGWTTSPLFPSSTDTASGSRADAIGCRPMPTPRSSWSA